MYKLSIPSIDYEGSFHNPIEAVRYITDGLGLNPIALAFSVTLS